MILVLDDNEDDLALIGHHFKKHGIVDFKLFNNPEPFLQEINEEVIIVIIDHYLSSIKTGLDVMKEVVDMNPVCYPIVVSGSNDPNIILDYCNNDVFRYVLKSTDQKYLDTIVINIRQAEGRIKRIIDYFKNG